MAESPLPPTRRLRPQLTAWIGRSETVARQHRPDAGRGADRHARPPARHRSRPAARCRRSWHWLYFLPMHRQSEIGADGHAKRGGFLPPVPLPRRMWAGSQFEFRAPIRVGDAVHATSTIADVDGEGRPHRYARVRQGAPRAALQRRGRAGAGRVPRHRLPRSAAARRRRAAAAAGTGPTPPGSARSCPTTCCCSATRP